MIYFTATYERENENENEENENENEENVISQVIDATPEVIDVDLLFNLQRFTAALISLQRGCIIPFYAVKINNIRVQ